jgi:hypothetical protein
MSRHGRDKPGHDDSKDDESGYFVSAGSGFTLSFGGAACIVISVIETRS